MKSALGAVGVLVFLAGISTADVDVARHTGLIIDDLRIEGLGITKPYIVEREIHVRVGEPLDPMKVAADEARLLSLDIFAHVDVRSVNENGRLVIVYSVEENLFILPSASVRFSDENGISVAVGAKSPNLLGRDIFLSTRLLFGGETEVELWLEDPWLAGDHFGVLLKYYHRERDNLIGDFEESSDEGIVGLFSNVGLYGRVGAEVSFISMRSDRDGITLSSDRIDNVPSYAAWLGYDSRNSRTETRSGWWNELRGTKVYQGFGNPIQFEQVDVDLRRYQSLPVSERHFLLASSLVTLRTGERLEEIAEWQLFGLGGTNTVRGWEFAYRTGQNQMLHTLEYRLSLMDSRGISLPFGLKYRGGVQLAVFGDAGAVWNGDEALTADRFIGGGGAGIRLIVPIIGVARVDFGFGQRNEGIFLHLGSFEKPAAARNRVR